MNRRGDWIQVFLIVLFAIILLVGIALLSLDKGKTRPERALLSVDLSDQAASAMLISLLRSATKEGTLADTIILHGDDQRIAELIDARIPNGTYYEMYVQWSDRTLYVRNYDLRNEKVAFDALAEDTGSVGEGDALLPQNIKIKLFIGDTQFGDAYRAYYHGQPPNTSFEVEVGAYDVDKQHPDSASTLTKVASSMPQVYG